MHKKQLLNAFNEDKLGMFIHWGPYAKAAGEWKGRSSVHWAEWIALHAQATLTDYEDLCRRFNPVAYNAEDWVRLAVDAGMRYLVYTTKHHDGFCMFRSEHTDFNIVDYTRFGRDPLAELAEACDKHGLRLGMYYSICDWHHREFPAKLSNLGSNYHMQPKADADISKYADYQIAQITELLTRYGPVSTVWFDGGGSFRGADRFALLKGRQMADTIRSLQPSCLINARIGGGEGDYGNPEQTIPGEIQANAFEVCMTIHTRWGYNRLDRNYKTGRDLIRKVCEVAHKGGNFLVNVGPDGEGRIIDRFATPLREVGRWLRTNGDAIYGARNSLFAEEQLPAKAHTTTRLLSDGNTRIFILLEEWPDDGEICLPDLKNPPLQAKVLGAAVADLPVGLTPAGVRVRVPQQSIQDEPWCIAVDVQGAPLLTRPVAKAAGLARADAALS